MFISYVLYSACDFLRVERSAQSLSTPRDFPGQYLFSRASRRISRSLHLADGISSIASTRRGEDRRFNEIGFPERDT